MDGMACGGHGITSSAVNGVQYNTLSHLVSLLSRQARVDRTARGVNRSLQRCECSASILVIGLGAVEMMHQASRVP